MYMRFLLTLLLGAIWLYGCQSEQLPVSSLAARVTEGTSDDRILSGLLLTRIIRRKITLKYLQKTAKS